MMRTLSRMFVHRSILQRVSRYHCKLVLLHSSRMHHEHNILIALFSLGRWQGKEFGDNWRFSFSLQTIYLYLSKEPKKLSGIYFGSQGRVDFSGSYELLSDSVSITLEFPFNLPETYMYFRGTYKQGINESLIGSWSTSLDDVMRYSNGTELLYRRMPADYLSFYPSYLQLTERPAQVQCKFAIDAVLADVRRKVMSWSHLKKRRDLRAAFLELNTRRIYFGPSLTWDDFDVLNECGSTISPLEGVFYSSRLRWIRAHTTVHECVYASTIVDCNT
jgi:hypothetical protein